MKIIFEGICDDKRNYVLEEISGDRDIDISGFFVDQIKRSSSYKSYYIKGFGDEFYDVSNKDEMIVGKIDNKGNIIANPEVFNLFAVNSLLHNIRKNNILIMECVNNLAEEANIFKEVVNDILNSNKSVLLLIDKVDGSIINSMNLMNDIYYLNFDEIDYPTLKNYIERAKKEIR